ncbi:CHAT domain-containing protein [Halosimplex halophilum]|uniref:hypothetical protein n=1 Tax=Halosimplex halophilum TaxID=2559572 RepID=UPI00107F0AC8|nr:hypothetical protein [Halosimplex halophilum]
MTDTNEDASPRFEPTMDPTGVRIVDPIESVEFAVGTDRPVDPIPVADEPFRFPVDATVEFEATEIEFPYRAILTVRDADGTHRCDLFEDGEQRFSGRRYTVELSKTPVKVYLAVEGELTVRISGNSAVVRTENGKGVRLGARSYHSSPAGTITTTEDPTDVASALSRLGSALKTRSPERSWPTLRGYPPLVEFGDALHVPDGLSSPDSGVSIVVPPRLDALLPVASLAFYLDATVRIGMPPRLRADGREWSLTEDGDIETTVANVLRRQFTLDCVVRTTGYYDFDLFERDLLADLLPFDPGEAYEWPLAARVAAYMDVAPTAVDGAAPRWRLTADLVPEPDAVEALPHLAHELAAIRCPTPGDIDDPGVGGVGRPVFGRDRSEQAALARGADEAWNQNFVYPETATSIEHAYRGPGVPVGASELSVSAYERSLRRDPVEDVETSVTVVTNDTDMIEGDTVAAIYDLNELASFDVRMLEGLSRSELADALATETDLLHYIGHVDDRGFECADGFLDARSVASVGAEAFFLNACTSYEQGRALVENGATGGIVTVADVFDSTAERVGETVARLLGQGFSLAAALEICKRTTGFPTGEYLVVADGGVRVTQNETGVPLVYRVTWDEGLIVTPVAFPARGIGLGTTVVPFGNENDRHFLAAGEGFPIDATLDAFAETIRSEPIPLLVDGDLYWSPDLTRDDIAGLVDADSNE